jgi:hypothetical protein
VRLLLAERFDNRAFNGSAVLASPHQLRQRLPDAVKLRNLAVHLVKPPFGHRPDAGAAPRTSLFEPQQFSDLVEREAQALRSLLMN